MLSGRWTCRRWYAANDPSAEVCTSCGWPRVPGTTPPDGATPLLRQPAGPARARPWWTRLARFAWVVIPVAVIGFGAITQARRDDSGQIVGSGRINVVDLAPGDCFNAPADEELADVEGRPCRESHQYEVFAIIRYPGGGEYPGENEIADHAAMECVREFEAYVGVPYMRSELDFALWFPTPSSWDGGDRETICAAFDPGDNELEGPIRDRER